MRIPWKTAALLGMACRSTSVFAQLKSFGEAEGFGSFATGGRGGTVYHVTNLNDAGAGSFRDAVSVSNRIVVFDLGGYINLTSAVSVKSNLTILGQTAPGDGIGIMGREVSFNGASNDVVRNIRFRQGDLDPDSSKSGINLLNATNLMFDHVSIEFAQWNNIDAVGADQITVQNSIIANPIGQQFNAHTETVGGSFTWANNIFANAHNRSPLAKINTQFVNNVIYNYQAGYTAGNTGTPFSHDVIGNYFFTGPSTTSSNNDYYQIGNNQKAYVKGNILDANNDGKLNGAADNTADSAQVLTNPWSPGTAGLPTLTAANAFAYDVTHAGATAHGYDQVDSPVIADVNSLGTLGRMWSHQTSTGLTNSGYGVLNDGTHIVDTNNNGIADAWETAHGLLLSDALGYKKLNPVGYTMLEQYANELTNSAATKTWTANGAAWSTGTNWTGGTPIVYDNAQIRGTGAANGSLVIAQPGANAMTLSIGGNGPGSGESVIVNGGGITIFDTLAVGDQNNGSLTINSGTVTASNIVLGNTVAGNNYTGTLSLNGGLLHVSQIVQGGGTPGNYTTGGSIQWSGGTLQGVSDFLITAPIAIGSNHAYVDSHGFSGTIAAVISGAGNLFKQGAGTLVLSNPSNNFTGTVNLTGGSLAVSKLTNGGAPSTLGASSSSAANLLFDGGALLYTGAGDGTDRLFTLTQAGGTIDGSGSGGIGFTNTGPIAFSGNGNRTLNFIGTETHTSFSPALGDAVGYQTAVTKDGSGRVLWTSKLSTYSGDTTILTGTIQPYNGGVLPFGPGRGNLVVDAGGTYSGAGNINALKDGPNGGGVVNGTGTFTVGNGDATGSFTGIVGGAMSVVKVGSGLQTLSGTNANTYTGPTTINGGAILFGDANSIGGTNKITVNSAGAVGFTPGIANAGLLARLDTASTGAFGLSGSNDTAATFNFISGPLAPYANMAIGSAGNVTCAGTYVPVGGLYRLGGGYGTINYTPLISGTSNVLIGNTGSTGVVVLSGTNTYTGTTTLRGSVLSIGDMQNGGVSSAMGAATSNAANLVFDGGVLKYTGSGDSTDRIFTITPNGGTIDSSGSGEVDFTNTASVVFSGNGSRALNLTGANGGNHSTFDPTLTDPVGGKLSVVKSGTGRWFIGVSNNTYSGDTTILGGTLQAWVDNILPSGAGRGNLNLTAGTLQMYGHNQSLNGLNGAGGIDNSSGTRSLTLGNGDGAGNFSGVISGGVNLTKTGTGTQVFSGLNTFVGSAQVNGGTFNLAAGSLSPSAFTNGSTFLHSGGTFAASTVANTGIYSQTGGTSTIGVLSSPAGTISVGGGISLATMKVSSFNVATMVVANNANVSVPTTAIVATQYASSLGISGNGTLDLANNELVVAATSAANIGSYLANAYRLNHTIPNVGDWTGSGITSSLAVARPYVFSVGVADGNTPSGQNSGIKINGIPIAAGQVLVRPTLVGDINLDGRVDHNDLNQLLSYRYNTGGAANYTDGDLNYSGTVGPEDINALLSAHYELGNSFMSPGAVPSVSASMAKAAAAKLTTASLTGSSARGVTPATTTIGFSGDGQPDYVYNPLTGDVKFVLDGFVPVTMAAAPSFIASIQFASAAGKIIFANDNPAIGNSAGAIESATLVYGALTRAPGFFDGFDLGRILPIGLTNTQLIDDLTVNYTVLNGGPTGTSDIVVATPEPTALAILGAGMAGLLGRRRRRNV